MAAVHIALCDDHPVFRAGITKVIDDEDDLSVVVEAGSAEELTRALRELDDDAVDLVLLDLELPGTGGLEVLPTLTPRYRVLIFSAFDDARRIKRAMQAGATGYVRKDSAPRELLASIRKAARGETVLDVDLAVRLAQTMRAEPDEIDLKRRVAELSPRQREVLALVAQGKSNREIGNELCVSEGTARNHVTKMLHMFEVPDRTKLALLLVRYGIDL